MSPSWTMRAVDQLAALPQADAEAGEVELARGVEPGHLRHLAADKGAPGLAAAFGHAGHDAGPSRAGSSRPTAT